MCTVNIMCILLEIEKMGINKKIKKRKNKRRSCIYSSQILK